MTEAQIEKGLKTGTMHMHRELAMKRRAEKEGTTYISPFTKTIVSVDHAVGNIEKEERSRSGIIIMSRYKPYNSDSVCTVVHEDRTKVGRAEDWVPEAVKAYHDYNADEMVVETNQGGKNLISEAVHKYDPDIVIHGIHSSRSKPERATCLHRYSVSRVGCTLSGGCLNSLTS